MTRSRPETTPESEPRTEPRARAFRDREQLRVFVEHTPAAVAMLDREMRYLVVSRGWLANYGLAEQEVIGKSHYELIPDIPEKWREIHRRVLAGAVERAEADSFPRRDGRTDWVNWEARPWYDGDQIGGIVLFSEVITARIRAERERARVEEELREEVRINETLRRIGTALASDLDLDRLVQTLTDEATRLCSAEFGAFFYNVTDAKGESYMLYTISGVPREAFSKFPMPRNTAVFAPTFRGEGVVRSDDITKDPRYGHNAPHHGMPRGHLPVRSYLAVPVVSRAGVVIGGLFFGHSSVGVFSDRDERMVVEVATQASSAFDNARLYGEAKAARQQAEAMQRRFRFLADASVALAESLNYEATLARVAQLAVPGLADWCTVALLDDRNELRRVASVHKDPALAGLVADYAGRFPPGQHKNGTLLGVVSNGRPVLMSAVGDAELLAAAQSEEHLAMLRALGCTSCMMVPIVAHGQTLGAMSFMLSSGERQYSADDLAVAEELSHRAALAIEHARLYRVTHRREESTAFLAEASAILGSSLDYPQTLQSLARLAVPRFADWCAVHILEGNAIEPLAVAHADAAKTEQARELQRRWPIDPKAPNGPAQVLRSGITELYEQIPDELLVAGARDEEHLRLSRALGLRSALVVPLTARGRALGALTLVWAESDRRYSAEDVPLLEELGRRAGTAIDNARLYKEAESAIRLRDEFLSIASHELKTPLTSLQLQVSAMLRRAKAGTLAALPAPEMTDRIRAVDRQLDRLATLVESLLDVSRATAGRLQLELEQAKLADVARAVVERLDADLRNAGCTVELTLDEDVEGRWDRLRLEQVATNLVTNALKYGAGQPIAIAVRRAPDDATRAQLQVTDHGIGIGEADQRRIFERFSRAVPAEHFGGLGLGLWIVRVFTEAMGGSVQVQSAIGQGSTFTIELPLEPAVSVDAQAP